MRTYGCHKERVESICLMNGVQVWGRVLADVRDFQIHICNGFVLQRFCESIGRFERKKGDC